jgi:VWFA-related protein
MFPSDVDLITVDAVVVDDDGRPVTGLTKDDFIVKEDGQVQDVDSFEAVVLPGVTRNAPATTAAGGRLFALVIDDLRLTVRDAHDARESLVRFIDQSLGKGDRLIVATTGGTIREAGSLPESRDKLVAAVEAVEGAEYEPEMVVDYMSDYEAYWISEHPGTPLRVTAQARAVDARRRYVDRLVLTTLQQVMAQLGTERGRKSILFVSRGLVADGTPMHRQTAALSREANAVVYFLDARGLRAGSDLFGTGGAQDLAIDTGGFTVHNTNDIGIGASRIADQSRAFYLLGFHPPAGKKPGEWRKLKVELKKKGYKVHARRGYTIRTSEPEKTAKVASF